MVHLLLAVIYLSFISLGLPDSLLGAAWPSMYGEFNVPVSYAGAISMIIAFCTVVSSLQSDRLTRMLGTGNQCGDDGSRFVRVFCQPFLLDAVSVGGALRTGGGKRGCFFEQLCGIAL